MLRKIICFIIFCLCLLQTKAQDSSAKNNPDIIPDHKPPENIGGTKTGDKRNKENLQSFSFYIKITDKQNQRKGIDANVKIVDLARNETLSHAKNRNSYLLYLNHKYSINVTAKNYNSFDTVYTAQKNKPFTLPIKLQRINLSDNVKSSTQVAQNDSTPVAQSDSTRVLQNSIKGLQNDSTKVAQNNLIKILKNGSTTNALLLIAGSVLFIITLVVFILSVRTRRDLRTAVAKISNLTDLIKANQQNMDESNAISEPVPKATGTTTIKSIEVIPQATEIKDITGQNEPVINKSNANAYFVCELMMTAGPRKDDFEDVDLGEDVCGCISDSNEAMVWVLDGTSDADRMTRGKDTAEIKEIIMHQHNEREYFSSRLLAQSIGNKLRKSFIEKNKNPLKEVVWQIVNEVKADWQKTIDELSAADKNNLNKVMKEKITIQCSTTVLIAKLSIDGALSAYRCGDSKMLLFENKGPNEIDLLQTELEEKSEENNDRIFFSLQLNKNNGDIGFFSNQDNLKDKPIAGTNINTVISFSDGIGINTLHLLKEQYKNNPELIRKELMYQLQGTEDDKSICFIEIKQSS